MTHGDRTLVRRAWRRLLHAQLDRRPVRAPVVEVGPRGTMVPVGARPATLATGRGNLVGWTKPCCLLLPLAPPSALVTRTVGQSVRQMQHRRSCRKKRILVAQMSRWPHRPTATHSMGSVHTQQHRGSALSITTAWLSWALLAARVGDGLD